MPDNPLGCRDVVTNKAFGSIKAGQDEAINHARGMRMRAKTLRFDFLDVRTIRTQVGTILDSLP